jgi:hypothetical protein
MSSFSAQGAGVVRFLTFISEQDVYRPEDITVGKVYVGFGGFALE